MSSSLISWIVSIVFIVFIIAGFFIGFWRGLKRSTVNLAMSIVGVIIAFFITPAITKAILSIKINVGGQSSSIHSAILNMITSNEDIASLIEKNPNLETFFLNLPQALANVILFIFITIAIQSLLYIVYKIITKIFFKVKQDEKKRRLTGGIVGAIKTLIVVLFAFMPLASLIGVVSTCTKEGDYGINPTAQVMTIEAEPENENQETAEGALLAGVLPETAINVIDGLENNLLTKMSGIFGLDDALFDYYGSFEVEGEKIVVRKEILNVYNVVDLGNQLSKVDSNYSFKNFNYKKITTNLDNLSSSPMFENIIADTLGELIMNYKDYSFIRDSQLAKDNAEVLDAISNGMKAYVAAGGSVSDYLTDDLQKLIDVSISLGENGIIDDVVSLEKLDLDNIIIVITSDENYQTFENAVKEIFNLNLVRDGVETIAPKLINNLTTEVDPIAVNTENWIDDDWDNLSTSLSSIAKRYGNIAKSVDVIKVLKDATILLDEDENYDIETILSEVGQLIDDVRGVNLLQTSENKPIVDKLLNKYNMPLPTENVISNNGTLVEIDTYKDLFEFISPSLVKARDEQVYSTIIKENSTNEKIEELAVIVSKEGNETLLSDIFMPLYQVEPTKSLIVDKLQSSINNEFVNLSVLSNYEEWRADLNYLSVLFKVLNARTAEVEENGQAENKTFLQLVLQGDFSLVVDNLTSYDVEPIIRPLFYAKSTVNSKTKILDKLDEDLQTISGAIFSFPQTITFEMNNTEDQTSDLCNILKKLLPLKDSYTEGGNQLKNADKELLAQTLEAMKGNAYRVETSSKTEEGMFKEIFIALVDKLKIEYAEQVTALEEKPDILEEKLGVTSLSSENYSKINYASLISLLDEAIV